MVVCIYYEFQFRCIIYDYLRFLSFFRYFDDLRAVVVYKSSDITTKYLVQDLLHQLQHHTYHSSMKLVLEEASNNTFRFLEGKFSMADSQLSCQWFSKKFRIFGSNWQAQIYYQSRLFFVFWQQEEDYSSCHCLWMADYFTGLVLHWCWYYSRVWVSDLWAFCQILPKKGIYIYT